MAGNIVFFEAHVSADDSVGRSCIPFGNSLVSIRNLCLMDCKHLAKKERMDTAVRTPHENGTLRKRGSGYPLENKMMSMRSFNSALDDSGRRVLDVFAFTVVVLTSLLS